MDNTLAQLVTHIVELTVEVQRLELENAALRQDVERLQASTSKESE